MPKQKLEYRIDRNYRSNENPDDFVVYFGPFRVAVVPTMREALGFLREHPVHPLSYIPRHVARYENGKRTWVPNPFYEEVRQAIEDAR